MTLDEFQARLRAICDAHVTAAKAAQVAYDDALRALSEAVGDAWDANAIAFAAVTQAELKRMLQAMQP